LPRKPILYKEKIPKNKENVGIYNKKSLYSYAQMTTPPSPFMAHWHALSLAPFSHDVRARCGNHLQTTVKFKAEMLCNLAKKFTLLIRFNAMLLYDVLEMVF